MNRHQRHERHKHRAFLPGLHRSERAGAVETRSLRGMPYLAELSEAGFSVWPFEDASWPLVLESYPRLLTGALVKSDSAARAEYLEGELREIPPELREVAADSADALDGAVSAVVMARHRDEIRSLGGAADPVARREGWIWYPEGGQADPARPI